MADETPPVFLCALCGAAHVATERDNVPPATAEEIATLKTKWDAVYARAEAAAVDPSVTKEQREKNWAGVDRAATAYLTRSRATGIWKLPETLTTDKESGSYLATGPFRLRCVECATP
jgi:hypothetical protein